MIDLDRTLPKTRHARAVVIMSNILVIDDDTELCELLTDYLTPEGFGVVAAFDGNRGCEKALSGNFDIIVLDVMLPGLNGFEILGRIRARSKVPVIMLTARKDSVDRIVGLEMGADDYLPKPFNPRELVARLRAILRRTSGNEEEATKPPPASVLAVGDIEMDPGNYSVTKSGEPVSLTTVEFNLLAKLLKSAGKVVMRRELIRDVLGRSHTAYDRSIDVHVSNIRKKLGYRIGHNDRIRAIRGVGYLYTSFPGDS